MQKPPVEVRPAPPGRYENTLREGERTLLEIDARWPRLEETAPGVRRVNRYYDALADRWRRRWEGPLLAQAREAPPDTAPWQARLDFTVTCLEGGYFSLCLDAEERVGERRPRRVRQGDIWLVPQGTPVKLRDLLPARRWWKGPILTEIRRQIGGRVHSGESVFYEDWVSLASRRFSPSRAYLTPQGPVVFYPIESIAPALEGFPSFLLPFPGRGLEERAETAEI